MHTQLSNNFLVNLYYESIIIIMHLLRAIHPG